MINVRRMANSMTSMVNPNRDATLRVNIGFITDDAGNQKPSFDEMPVKIQAQSLQSDESDHLGLVDRQGEFISAYAYGSISAIQRWLKRGESQLVFVPYGETEQVAWNVDKVLESYPTWVRLLLVRLT